MRTLTLLITLLALSVTYSPIRITADTEQEPYLREVFAQAHAYHGITGSVQPIGEAYFMRDGKRCNLISTIREWKVIF